MASFLAGRFTLNHLVLAECKTGEIMLSHQLRQLIALAILAFGPLAATPAKAQARGAWTQAGVLTCRLNPSIGFIIVGHQSMECNFQEAGSDVPQRYEGAINTVGLDIGVTAGGVLLGRCSRRPKVCPAARLPASMWVPRATSVSVSVLALTF